MQSHANNKMIPVAVFDISSGAVTGAHALIRKHTDAQTPAVILAQVKNDAPLAVDPDIAHYLEQTVSELESVIASVSRADKHKPEKIQLVLASPWYISQMRVITYKKTTPFICTEKLINQLIEKEIEYIVSHPEDSLGALGSQYIIVEQQLSLIKLNGYTTNAPHGKHASSLEIYLTVTVAPKIALERFKSAITRVYGPRDILVTTSTFATHIVARDHMAVDRECFVVDVGEEVTDVAFVKEGLFLYEHSFPIGMYHLYRALGRVGGHTPIEAMSMIEAYRLNKTGTGSALVETALESFKNDWQKGLQKILDDGHFGFCLPDQCFITADPRFNIFFSDTIKNDPFIQHTCSRGIVRPTVIGADLFESNIVTLDGTVPEVSLICGILFVERLLQQ